jgi:hypothetical protein
VVRFLNKGRGISCGRSSRRGKQHLFGERDGESRKNKEGSRKTMAEPV